MLDKYKMKQHCAKMIDKIKKQKVKNHMIVWKTKKIYEIIKSNNLINLIKKNIMFLRIEEEEF